jgi:hypothetical protein
MTSNFLQQKVEICWSFLLLYCKFEYFCYLKKCSPFFNIIKLKKMKTLLRTVYAGHEKTFSQPDHLIL